MGKMLSGKTPFSSNCHLASTDLVTIKNQGKPEIPQIFISKSQAVYFAKCKNKNSTWQALLYPFLPNNFMDESGNWVEPRKLFKLNPSSMMSMPNRSCCYIRACIFKFCCNFSLQKFPSSPRWSCLHDVLVATYQTRELFCDSFKPKLLLHSKL